MSGLKSIEAKKWIMSKLGDLERLNFPDDWEEPVKHYLEDSNLHTYVLP
jgi:hypothetical protein